MLDTNLKHLETKAQYDESTGAGAKAVVICGRMGPMCLPVYDIAEGLESKYPDVRFFDMDYDDPVASDTILRLPEVRGFQGLPFTVYFRDGKVVAATSSIQDKQQVKAILDSKMK
ncbi:MAG: thioredoxin family protein [Deltaproteobacteria bacterium]|nr:thioredoxin family protein [Deltaproteobacteria bacterium]